MFSNGSFDVSVHEFIGVVDLIEYIDEGIDDFKGELLVSEVFIDVLLELVED